MSTEPRRARPDEVPAFGSVWTWNYPVPTSPRYLALGLGPPNSMGWRPFLAYVIGTDKVVSAADLLWWSAGTTPGGTTLENWTCVDEGPDRDKHMHIELRGGTWTAWGALQP